MKVNSEAVWVKCPSGCDDFYCTVHDQHVYDCRCPSIDVWAAHSLDPYSPPTAKIEARAMLKVASGRED